MAGHLFHKHRKLSEWKSHLEMSSRPQAKENSKQYLLLRIYNLKKAVVGYP